MGAFAEDSELMDILSTTPLHDEEGANRMSLIVSTNNTRKAFESLLKQKLVMTSKDSSNASAGTTA
jgi:hypothetical protein